jgi:hypothetical protein
MIVAERNGIAKDARNQNLKTGDNPQKLLRKKNQKTNPTLVSLVN